MIKKLITLLIGSFLCLSIQAQQKVLHYSETGGYNHNTRNQSFDMFTQIGAPLNLTFVHDQTGAEFNSQVNLNQYIAVIFSNTSGSNILNTAQRVNFKAYIENGGSYIGIHAASDTYRHSTANGGGTGAWDWYAENVAGCSVQTSPNHTAQNHNNNITAQIPITDPLLNNIPNPWNKTEEYYYWQNGYLNNSFTEILRVGQTGGQSYDAPRMVAHVKSLQWGGVAFYTSLGHAQSNFTSDQNFRQLMTNALQYVKDAGSLPIIFRKPITDPQVNNTVLYNPVTPTSDITFSANVAKFSSLTMTVYDLSGRKLVSYHREEGPNRNVLWKQPATLSPGTYHLSVESRRGLVYAGLLNVVPE